MLGPGYKLNLRNVVAYGFDGALLSEYIASENQVTAFIETKGSGGSLNKKMCQKKILKILTNGVNIR